MKGTINLKGVLEIQAETELEGFALEMWWQHNIQGKDVKLDNFLLQIRPVEKSSP